MGLGDFIRRMFCSSKPESDSNGSDARKNIYGEKYENGAVKCLTELIDEKNDKKYTNLRNYSIGDPFRLCVYLLSTEEKNIVLQLWDYCFQGRCELKLTDDYSLFTNALAEIREDIEIADCYQYIQNFARKHGEKHWHMLEILCEEAGVVNIADQGTYEQEKKEAVEYKCMLEKLQAILVKECSLEEGGLEISLTSIAIAADIRLLEMLIAMELNEQGYAKYRDAIMENEPKTLNEYLRLFVMISSPKLAAVELLRGVIDGGEFLKEVTKWTPNTEDMLISNDQQKRWALSRLKQEIDFNDIKDMLIRNNAEAYKGILPYSIFRFAFSRTILETVHEIVFQKRLLRENGVWGGKDNGDGITVEELMCLWGIESHNRELDDFKRELVEDNALSIDQVDVMSGYDFEAFLKDLFSKRGYQVIQTKLSGDQGADLILQKNGEKTVAQAKRASMPVGNKAVQEIVAAIKHYSARNGMVITNNTFTKSAVDLAKSNGIVLIERNELTQWIREASRCPNSEFDSRSDFQKTDSGLSSNASKTEKDISLYLKRGERYLQRGAYEKAITSFAKAVNIDPKNADCFVARGAAYMSWIGDGINWDLISWAKLIDWEWRDLIPYANKINLEPQIINLNCAIADFSKAIELEPRHASAYCSRGEAYGRQGDLELAFADLSKGLEIAPEVREAYNYRGDIYSLRGDYSCAVADYEKYLELYEKITRNMNDTQRLSTYVNQKKRLATFKILKIMGIKSNENPTVAMWIEKGTKHAKAGDYNAAISEYTEAIQACPQSFYDIYVLRGTCLQAIGRLDESIDDFNKVIKISPRISIFYMKRGWAYTLKGALEKGFNDASYALELDAFLPTAHTVLGCVYLLNKDIAQGLSEFNKAIEIDPQEAWAYYWRRIIHFELKEYEKCWEDVCKSKALVLSSAPEFIANLEKVSGKKLHDYEKK